MKKIAVFASGRGSNFEAIAQAVKKGTIKAQLALLVCDNADAPVIQKAQRESVPVCLVCRNDFPSKAAFEDAIVARLREEKIDLIVLAGYMRIISPRIIGEYPDRIMNIHPALLPSFKGAHAIKDAYEYGVKTTGVTVHFVDEKTDHGPIILQQAIDIKPGESIDSLEERIHKVEHKIYPEAVRLFLEGRLKVTGRKVELESSHRRNLRTSASRRNST
jgi:phosphoribosylglycinamide formyltransferase-1